MQPARPVSFGHWILRGPAPAAPAIPRAAPVPRVSLLQTGPTVSTSARRLDHGGRPGACSTMSAPPFGPQFFLRVVCAQCDLDPVVAVSPDHSHPSPLTDREWAVLLSVFAERGRFRKSRAALDWLSRGLLRGLVHGGGGRCGGVMGLPPTAYRLFPVDPECRRTWTPPTRTSFSTLHAALTPTPGAWPGEHHRFPASGAPPRVSSQGSILGSRVRVSGFHLREGSRFVTLCLCDLPLLLARISMIAPGQLPLRRCGVPVRRGAFGVRKADGGRRSRRLSLSRTLVLAIMLPQSGDTLIDPVGLVPLQVVERSPSIQLESRDVLFLLERFLQSRKVEYVLAFSAEQYGLRRVFGVVPPDACSGRAFAYTVAAPDSRTWGTVFGPSGSLLFQTAGFRLGWLACWQFVRLARLN